MSLWLNDIDVELRCGDCRAIMELDLAADSVDAIVTSPPYADQRNYERRAGATGHTRNTTRRARSDAPMLYAEQFADTYLPPMARVLAPQGSLMLNLGVIMRDGEESEYADEILRRARRAGWKLLHRMIWKKPNIIPLSHPTYLHIKHEWVFWLARDVDAYRGFDADTRTPHAEGTLRRIGQAYMTRKDERYMRRGKTYGLHPDGARPCTVFDAAVGGETGIDHPAIMPLKLAAYLVSLSCPPGGIVLDPFAGSGTTLLAARQRGRRAIGIELEPKYLPVAASRLQQLSLSTEAASRLTPQTSNDPTG